MGRLRPGKLIDRREDLLESEDIWLEVSPHLHEAASAAIEHLEAYAYDLGGEMAGSLIGRLEEKFRRGEAEHGRDWLDMAPEQLEREIVAEIQDLVIYYAMIRARWQMT